MSLKCERQVSCLKIYTAAVGTGNERLQRRHALPHLPFIPSRARELLDQRGRNWRVRHCRSEGTVKHARVTHIDTPVVGNLNVCWVTLQLMLDPFLKDIASQAR